VKLPSQLLNFLSNLKGFDKEAFESIHASGEQVTSIRINPAKKFKIKNSKSKIPWTDYGFYLDERPSFTFDPLFHAGCYYVQEASSMFLEQALLQTVDLSQPLKVLDLCAAPGGKSTHIQSLISKDSFLVSNEVIRSRANILKDNIIKWGCENVIVTNNDPKDFAALENYFDIIVVDAPCSGSGLFRREPDAMEEWSLNHVQLCSQRQQRILADIWPSLKRDGILVYTTCSYSKEENEDIGRWLKEFPIAICKLAIDPTWGITDSVEGFRFWPDKVKGEGFFVTCFRKTDGKNVAPIKTGRRPEMVSKKELDTIVNWAITEGRTLLKNHDRIYAWPEKLSNHFNLLLNQLRVTYSGTIIGAILRDKLLPDHALAMSLSKSETINSIELTYEQAIDYLKRKDLKIETQTRGWQLVTFEKHPLGWINALPNRINNYYPKELRIFKDI